MINQETNKSRRQFIRNGSLVTTGFFIIPRFVLGRGFVAPSDKLNIAGIGVGGKAEVNLPYAYNKGSDNIVALCDVDDRMAVNARKSGLALLITKIIARYLIKKRRISMH